MAAIALLGIILGLHGVNADKVAAVTLGFVISPKVFPRKIIACAATLMTIQTPFLLMALFAVVACLAGQNSVSSPKVGIVIRCNTFALVAVIALLDFHLGIFFMRDLFCIRLLLEIHQGASQKRNYEK